jgi:HAMP domain-containing protein
MRLLAKFNLIFIVVFGAGLGLATWLAHDFLHQNAEYEIGERARLMMQTTLATREYTTTQIKPLLIRRERTSDQFLPQTVPAFAATEVFRSLQRHNPDYSYKEAALNPTNLRDRAADWEADIINQFRNNSAKKDVVGERDTPNGRSFYRAQPITITDPACLECHDTARRAPRAVIDQYGPNNGFGWKLNETIGAQIVSVPETLVIKTADRALTQLVLDLVILSVFTLVSLDLMLIFTVIRPVSRLSRLADDISQGKMEVEELPVKGKDEISVLASSFNRMQRSLQRAMKLLSTEED